MRIRCSLLLLAILALPCLAIAADKDEPTTYVIKQGDTLWGLSERFLKDPKYWPKMWSNNGEVTNPHLIYPGQTLRIFPNRVELAPKGQQAASGAKAAPAAATSSKASDLLQEVTAEKSFPIYGTEGFILEKETKLFGTVTGIHHDRIMAGDDDIVYTDLGRNQGMKGGEKFSVFRKDVTVNHPVTNEVMGTKIIPLGSLQITDVEQKSSRAIITRAIKEIVPGSYLVPFQGNRRLEVSLKMPAHELRGYIVDSYSGINVIAAGDVVYIDLGSAQGAEPGNMLYVVRDVSLDQRYVEGRIDKLPQELLGALVILRTGKKVATALVVKSIDAIYKGDRIVSVTK